MDFISGLSNSPGKIIIFVVVCRLSKYAYFLPLKHPYTAAFVAQIFFQNVFKLYGLPNSIVNDRVVVFLSSFWQELFRLQGVSVKFSPYHPELDRQIEVVNRTLEMYLTCFTSARPKEWLTWLPWADYGYDTSYHGSIKMSPYEAVYDLLQFFHTFLVQQQQITLINNSGLENAVKHPVEGF